MLSPDQTVATLYRDVLKSFYISYKRNTSGQYIYINSELTKIVYTYCPIDMRFELKICSP